jgi:integrin beta 3
MTKAELAVIMASVKSYVEARLVKSERSGPAGERGERGDPGRDAAPVDIAAIVAEVLRQMPPAINGVDGRDGKDGRDGIDGTNGRDGIDGKRGLDGVAGPQGERGESIQGPQGERGLPGESIRGIDGAPGKDAVLPDIEPIVQRVFEAGFAKWAIDIERRAHDLFQRAIDKMPLPKDGRDGFSLEDFVVADDGAGNITLAFKRGELSREHTVSIPWPDHYGVWREGEAYRYANNVTWAGSVWRCIVPSTTQKPGKGSTDWRLIVKCGEDGRPGFNGKDGERGPQGPAGGIR